MKIEQRQAEIMKIIVYVTELLFYIFTLITRLPLFAILNVKLQRYKNIFTEKIFFIGIFLLKEIFSYTYTSLRFNSQEVAFE